MKLLTLNTHSLIEDNYEEKLLTFVNAIISEKPQIIALQEVNQTLNSAIADGELLSGFFCSTSGSVLREDNHIMRVAKMLRDRGFFYYWTWKNIKCGFGKYEEGVGVMSLSEITAADVFYLSDSLSYDNWRTRCAVGITVKDSPLEHYYSVHFGKWNEDDESFEGQWLRAEEHLAKVDGRIFLMGDFNNCPSERGEGYDRVLSSAWYDTYSLSKKKDDGVTVEGKIDGWQGVEKSISKMRIDQIWCNQKIRVLESKTIFNGLFYEKVSDHNGIIIEL